MASTALLAKIADYGVVHWAIDFHGDAHVGIWLAMNRLADAVNIPILAVTNAILLPLLSANAQQPAALRGIMKPIFRQTFGLTFLGFGFVFLVYPFLMKFLFSAAFQVETNWTLWQVTGDFFRSNAFLLSILCLATGATRFFFWLEISSIAVSILLTIGLSQTLGMDGIFIAHTIRFGLYWICLFWRFRQIVK